MSQFWQGVTAGSLPPTVLEQFDLDISDATILSVAAAGGSAVPVSHAIRITGDNGITTVALPNVPGAFEIRFSRGEVQTVGAVTSNVITLPLVNNSTITLQIIATGYSDNNEGIGGYGTITVKNVAGVASLVGTSGPVDLLISADSSLTSGTVTVTVAGGSLLVNVKGVAGRIINWTVALPGIVSS